MKRIKHTLEIVAFIIGVLVLLYYGLSIRQVTYVIVAMIATIGILKIYIKVRSKLKYLNSGILQLDEMSGVEFEEWFAYKLEKMGYKTELTIASNDYGADIIAVNKEEMLVIQTKRYADKVGIKAVQEVIGAMSYYNDEKYADSTRGIVITNSWFTSQAKNLAEKSEVELWDRDYLLDHIL